MEGKRRERVGEGKGRGGGGRLAAGAGAAVGETFYRLPRSIGGGEISPQDLGAHLWVHTDEPGTSPNPHLKLCQVIQTQRRSPQSHSLKP